jgi:hypothetical protein
VSDRLSGLVLVVHGVAPSIFRRSVDRLNDVIEEHTDEGRDLRVGHDEALLQSRHRGEVAAGQLVVQRDAIGELVAKVGKPHTPRGGLGVEPRQQPVYIADYPRPRKVEPTRVATRPGKQVFGDGIEHRSLVR